MLIKWVELNNFEVYKGAQRLDFCGTDEDSISLVVGENSGGKSTIVRAMKFLFYGTCKVPVNYKHAYEVLKKGAVNVSCSVRAEVEFDTAQGLVSRIIERSVTEDAYFKNESPIEIGFRNSSKLLQVHRPKESGVGYVTIEGRDAQNEIDQQFPKRLFDFYFVTGETVSDILNGNLADPIKQSLFRSAFISAENALEQAEKKIRTQQSKAFNSNRKLAACLDELKQLNKQKVEFEQKHATVIKKRDSAKELEEQYEDDYIKASASTAEQAAKDYENSKIWINEFENERKDKVVELTRGIGNALAFAFTRRMSSDTIAVLNKLKQDEIFPANIYQDFLTKLLERKECVCGQNLEKGAARKRVEEINKACLKRMVGEDLESLQGALSRTGATSITAKRLGYSERTFQSMDAVNDKVRQKGQWTRKRNQAQALMDDDAVKIAKKAKDNRDKQAVIKAAAIKDVGRYEVLLEQLKKKINDQETLKGQLAPVGNQNFDKFDKMVEICSKLEELLAQTKDRVDLEIRKRLNIETRAIYDAVANDGSVVHIDRETYLPYLTKGGQVVNQGGAQTQAMVIAYIIALSKVRTGICAALKEAFSLKLVADQAFFLDSPFANMAGTFADKMATALAGQVRQLVFMLAGHQYNLAKKALEGKVSSIYKTCLRTSATGFKDSSVTLWDGAVLNLVDFDKKEQLPYSELERVI